MAVVIVDYDAVWPSLRLGPAQSPRARGAGRHVRLVDEARQARGLPRVPVWEE
ncbi:hypothetical protein [Nonomuraea longispora]|uniref:hypothetical protein n=1 Tax=Nonomuraea longispora TaxID=1848320 RepID=UPI001404AD4B|nr:hypothetical protein [Nonomuraea longispora]